MSLKETKAESGVFGGCGLTALIGGILGSVGGYLVLKGSESGMAGAEGLFIGMAVLIGFIVGGIFGGVVGLVISALSAKKEKEEEEF